MRQIVIALAFWIITGRKRVGGTRSRGLSVRQRPVSPGVRCLGERFLQARRFGREAHLREKSRHRRTGAYRQSD